MSVSSCALPRHCLHSASSVTLKGIISVYLQTPVYQMTQYAHLSVKWELFYWVSISRVGCRFILVALTGVENKGHREHLLKQIIVARRRALFSSLLLLSVSISRRGVEGHTEWCLVGGVTSKGIDNENWRMKEEKKESSSLMMIATIL